MIGRSKRKGYAFTSGLLLNLYLSEREMSSAQSWEGPSRSYAQIDTPLTLQHAGFLTFAAVTYLLACTIIVSV